MNTMREAREALLRYMPEFVEDVDRLCNYRCWRAQPDDSHHRAFVRYLRRCEGVIEQRRRPDGLIDLHVWRCRPSYVAVQINDTKETVRWWRE